MSSKSLHKSKHQLQCKRNDVMRHYATNTKQIPDSVTYQSKGPLPGK